MRRGHLVAAVVLLAVAAAPVAKARAGPAGSVASQWAEFQSSYVTPSLAWAKSKLTSSVAPEPTEDASHETFLQWKETHGAAYAHDSEEHQTRFATFQENVRLIKEHNQQDNSYRLAVNQFADLTNDEFKAKMTTEKVAHQSNSNGVFRYADADMTGKEKVDWRKKMAVTPVKNQGQCGDCWSFSTTGSVEGINSIVFGKLFSLSEQELVDCDVKFDHGCNGGLMDYAFDYLVQNGGIDSERDYPYVSEDGHKEECKNKKATRDVGIITGWEDVPANDEKALQKAAAHQPVSVAIEADTFPFQFYSSGVLTSKACGTRLDHAVLVVGYGVDEVSDQPYWIVKNSWGETWGEEGYLRIARDPEGIGPGICGIAMAASYPTLDSSTPNPNKPKSAISLQ